jgi:opacity protein-like surface antigen
MWKILAAASTAVALLGAPALADMTGWDTSADRTIDRDEFGTGFGEGGVFSDWDADADTQLTEDEWTAGFGERYDESEFGLFSDWDANQDTFVDENEFDEGVFGSYDADEDDLWGGEEYGAYEEDEWF